MYSPRVIPHRPCGRAHSPPTWAWYEQLQPEDLESGSEYCSDNAMEAGEDNEEYNEDESGSEDSSHIVHVNGEHLAQEEDDSEEMRSVENNLNHTHTHKDAGSFSPSATPTLKDLDGSDNEEQASRLTSEMKGKQKPVDPPAKEPAPIQPMKIR